VHCYFSTSASPERGTESREAAKILFNQVSASDSARRATKRIIRGLDRTMMRGERDVKVSGTGNRAIRAIRAIGHRCFSREGERSSKLAPSRKPPSQLSHRGLGRRNDGRPSFPEKKIDRQSINPRHRARPWWQVVSAAGDVHSVDERGLGEQRVIIKAEQSSGTCKTRSR